MNIEKKTLKGTENIVKEIMIENVSELGKEVINSNTGHIQDTNQEKNNKPRKETPLIVW